MNKAEEQKRLLEALKKQKEEYGLSRPASQAKKEAEPLKASPAVPQAKYKAVPTSDGYKLEEAPPKLDIICMDGITSQDTKWLWYPYLPLGKIVLMQGDPGQGKTTLALFIAAIISSGQQFYDETPFGVRVPATVIYQTAEDGLADTIKPRLESMKPDFKNIFVIDEDKQGLTLADSRIEAVLIDKSPKLFVIDPLQAYLGADVDMHKANQVRPIMSKIGALAEKYSCTFLFIVHPPKMAAKALYSSLGTIDIPAVARSILAVGSDPENPEQRVMAHVKSSLAKHGSSILFSIDRESGVTWDGYSSLTPDDVMSARRQEGRGKPSAALEEAIEFLVDVITPEGYAERDEIIKQAEAKGVKKSTLYNAKKEAKISDKKSGFGANAKTIWYLESSKDRLPY